MSNLVNPITGTEYFNTFEDAGIQIPATAQRRFRSTCPRCSHERKKKNEKCLSVDIDAGIWYCFHCGWKGRIISGDLEKLPEFSKKYVLPDYRVFEWFKKRGISKKTVEKFKIGMLERHDGIWIAFPYYLFNNVVNVKYRKLNEKKFFQEKDNAIRVFYNHEALLNKEIIIVEGEIDALSFAEAGFDNVISVPNGANLNSDTIPDFLKYASKFKHIWERVYIAVDNDEKGEILAEELSKRFAKYRCYRVKFPPDCKDANEVLVKHGKARLRVILQNMHYYEVKGVESPMEWSMKVLDFKNKRLEGISTGVKELDKYWKLLRGELVVITGAPGAGKSEFMEYLMYKLIQKHRWKFILFTAEKYYDEFFYNFAYKIAKTEEDKKIIQALKIMNRYIRLINFEEINTIDAILDKVEELMLFGIDCLVIDPYNQLEHSRPAYMSETEYISKFLSKVRNFAKKYDIIVFIIAHPVKLKKLSIAEKERFKQVFGKAGTFDIPTLYSISGSANWYNKADAGLVVYRFEDNTTRVFIQKIRRGWLGKLGYVDFIFDENLKMFKPVGHADDVQEKVTKIKEYQRQREEEEIDEDDIPF